jgi:hypothetical protein
LNIPKAWSFSLGTLLSEVISPRFEKKFYAPQLVLLPIGAYEPRWFMSLLTKKGDRLAVSSPEKAGGGGSSPSLATDNLKGCHRPISAFLDAS